MQRDEGGRGIRRLCRPEGTLESVACNLRSAGRVTLLTGFPCLMQNPIPTETDGPSGTVAVARALLRLHDFREQAIRPAIVMATDDCNGDVLSSCARIALPKAQGGENRSEKQCSWKVEIFPPLSKWTDAQQKRLERLADWSQHIFALERASASLDGNCYTMSKSIMGPELIAPFDQLFQADFRRQHPDYTTSAVGDGGNELGMGLVADEVKKHITNGETIASATPADLLLCASVSNWGGYAIAGALEILAVTAHGCKVPTLVPSDEEEAAVLQGAIDAGARDGISGRDDLSVDGMKLEAHLKILQEIRNVVSSYREHIDSKSALPYFAFVAGASGKIPGEDSKTGMVIHPRKSPRHQMSRHGEFWGPLKSANGKSFTGGNGPTAKRVIRINSMIADVRARIGPDRPLFLATQSFGGRAVVHALSNKYFQGKTKNGPAKSFPLGEGDRVSPLFWKENANALQYPRDEVAGVLVFGYPLEHEEQDRSLPLFDIPAGTRILFISGSRDGTKVNISAQLQGILPRLACRDTSRLHVVARGKHNPWEGASDIEIEMLHEVISEFVKECIAGRESRPRKRARVQ